MRLAIPMLLAALLFVLGMLASACGRAGAADAEVPWPIQMTCVKIRLTPEWLGARCENEEAICYVANGGLSCQWKPQ